MSAAPITEANALAAYPELRGLVTIRRAGWRFIPLHDAGGELVGIDGFRPLPGHMDGIRIRSRDQVTAIRGDLFGAVLWEQTGPLAETIAALLALPDPSYRYLPRALAARSIAAAHR